MNKLNRKFSRFGISNLMIYITVTMLLVYVMQTFLKFPIGRYIALTRDALFQGEVWRLITFVFQPPAAASPVFLILSLYFFYFVGTSLEDAWGTSRFTLYYLFGVAGAIIAALISGRADNIYLNLSLFFAFAHLFPDHRILLFFIIPIKVKYLAYVDWIFFLVGFIFGDMVSRLAIVFSVLNYLLFFGPDIFSKIKDKLRYSKKRREFRKQMKHNQWNQ